MGHEFLRQEDVSWYYRDSGHRRKRCLLPVVADNHGKWDRRPGGRAQDPQQTSMVMAGDEVRPRATKVLQVLAGLAVATSIGHGSRQARDITQSAAGLTGGMAADIDGFPNSQKT